MVPTGCQHTDNNSNCPFWAKKVIVEASGRDSWRQTVKRAANVKVRWKKKNKSLLLMRRRTCDNIRTICNHFGMRVSIKIIFL